MRLISSSKAEPISSSEAEKELLRLKDYFHQKLDSLNGSYYKARKNSSAFTYKGFYLFFRDSPTSLEIGELNAGLPAKYPIVVIGLREGAEGGIAEYNDGRRIMVRRPRLRGNRSPVSENTFRAEYRGELIKIADAEFVSICSLDKLAMVPEALCEYAAECQRIRDFAPINPDLDLASINNTNSRRANGFDPGIKEWGTRSEACFEAAHSPIAYELRDQILSLGFEVAETTVVHPDLLVVNGDKRILFEIKPEAKSQDLMLACAQLIIYNQFAKAKRLILVTQELPSGELMLAIRNVMKEHRIELLEYVSDPERKITFPRIKQMLA